MPFLPPSTRTLLTFAMVLAVTFFAAPTMADCLLDGVGTVSQARAGRRLLPILSGPMHIRLGRRASVTAGRMHATAALEGVRLYLKNDTIAVGVLSLRAGQPVFAQQIRRSTLRVRVGHRDGMLATSVSLRCDEVQLQPIEIQAVSPVPSAPIAVIGQAPHGQPTDRLRCTPSISRAEVCEFVYDSGPALGAALDCFAPSTQPPRSAFWLFAQRERAANRVRVDPSSSFDQPWVLESVANGWLLVSRKSTDGSQWFRGWVRAASFPQVLFARREQ